MEKDIKDLTKEELTNPGLISSIFDSYCDNERKQILYEVLDKAKEYNVVKQVKQEMNNYNKNSTVAQRLDNNPVMFLLNISQKGEPEPSIENFLCIMEEDEYVKSLFKYDVFSNKIIYTHNKTERVWNDMDDSILRSYIEKNYGLYNQQKYFDAFNTTLKNRGFHPIKNIIESKEWDGIHRIDRFLTDILRCEDTDYVREVSRMIFYGGISRLYKPGCKFDYMPIFIGTQGSYKSSIVNWLALDDKYYTDIPSIEGKDALEQLQGRWVCEFAELLAMVRTKDVEAMKSFITRTTDKYRESYGRRTNEYPRQCIFIGTTNDYQFLSDKTGNRRYLPVKIGLQMGMLSGKEDSTKEYILECWREALSLYKNNKIYLTIPSKYYQDVLQAQEDVLEDDPKTGLMLQYLEKKNVGDKVCGLEIFTNCFNGIKKNYGRAEAKDITRFMSYQQDWKRGEKSLRLGDYGVQRYWEKIDVDSEWSDLN